LRTEYGQQDVGRDGDHPDAQKPDALGCRCQGVRPAGTHGEVTAFPGEPHGDHQADPAVGTRHQRNLPPKPEFHMRSLA
jgi:hypothetical protein